MYIQVIRHVCVSIQTYLLILKLTSWIFIKITSIVMKIVSYLKNLSIPLNRSTTDNGAGSRKRDYHRRGFIGFNASCTTPKRCKHGFVSSIFDRYVDGTSFDRFCVPGYYGECCETELDECDPNPCQHGGTCSDHVNAYTCTCITGYTGHSCEHDVDDCSNNPCPVNSVCQDSWNNYICLCPAGYTGHNCDIDIDECASYPCLLGGHCQDLVNSYNCSCPSGYTGDNCENEIDECSSWPCQNGGFFVDQNNDYTCICLDGDTGKNCERASKVKEKPMMILNNTMTIKELTLAVHIPCHVEGMPPPTVKWEAISGTFGMNVHQIGHYLVFRNVTKQNAGFYVCIATNRVGMTSKVINIQVQAVQPRPYKAPVISATASVTVIYHSEAVLFCNVTGYPAPNITWQFKQNVGKLRIDGGIVRIANVTKADEGTYICTAANSVGTSSANITLKTIHDVPRILSGPKMFAGKTGQSCNFTCHVTGAPTPNIVWTFTNFSNQLVTLPSHTLKMNNETITLNSIQKSGIIVCTATNEFGKDRATANIIALGGSTFG